MYGQRLSTQQHAGTHTPTQRMHTSCYKLLSSPRRPSHVWPALRALRELTSHSQQPRDCLQRGFSRTPHILSLQWGQRNVSEMTDVEDVEREWPRFWSSVCSTMPQREDPGYELSNMIKTRGLSGLWISRKEGSVLFQLPALVRSHWQPGIAV